MAGSLHGPLRSSASEYFVGNGDFLNSAPVVLVAPDVAPAKEENHGNHGDEEAADEVLSAYHRHKEEGEHRGSKAVLEPTELVLRDPEFAVLQVDLGGRRDGRVVNQEVHKL